MNEQMPITMEQILKEQAGKILQPERLSESMEQIIQEQASRIRKVIIHA